jgi:hypothetical protein
VKRGAGIEKLPSVAWPNRFVRGCALAGVLLISAGCRDGYSTDDQQERSPSDMTGDQLLHEMNKLGAQPHLGRAWRYRLRPGCVLEVTVGSVIATSDHRIVPLARASIETRVDATDKTYDVHVRQVGTTDTTTDGTPVRVLEGGKWTDSVAMRSLLQYLQRRCLEVEAPKP